MVNLRNLHPKAVARPSTDRSSEDLSFNSNPVINTKKRKFRCSFGQFGVLVALIIGVSFPGVETAFRGRRALPGSCYNRRRISELESRAASASKGHYFHRHTQGNNVKSFAPVSE